MDMKTKHDIPYTMAGGRVTTIPKGTGVQPASNLPADNDAGIAYWAFNWAGMDEYEESHARNYGFGVGKDDVTV